MKEKKRIEDVKQVFANGVANVLVRVKLRIADALSAWESNCSYTQKKVLLFLFVGLGIAFCTSIIANAWWLDNTSDRTVIDFGKPHQGYPIPFIDSLDSTNVK